MYTTYEQLKNNPKFYSIVYNYYVGNGYNAIIIRNLVSIFTSLFIILFSIFIIFFIDWAELLGCNNEQICKGAYGYIIYPLSYHSTKVNIYMICFIIISSLYWLWYTLRSIMDIIMFNQYNKYFKYTLNIDINNISLITWNDVINEMIKNDNTLSHSVIINHIMRIDNYMIAIVSNNILDMRKKYYSDYFIWMFKFCLLSDIINSNNRLNISLLHNHKKIKKRMIIIGLTLLILSPIIFTIASINYVIRCTTDFYTRKLYFGPKDWSDYAKWNFREYNEINHVFNRRIQLSHKYASKYENRFSSPIKQTIIDNLAIIMGSFLTVLVFITFYDEKVLLYFQIYNRNLLWYGAYLSAMMTIFRMMMADKDYLEKDHDSLMKDIAKYTKYYPDRWKGKKNYKLAIKEFHDLYNYKIVSLFRQSFGFFVVPLLFIFSMPKKIPKITKYIEDISKYNDKVGCICKYGDFDLDKMNVPDEDENTLLNLNNNIGKLYVSMQSFNEYYELSDSAEMKQMNVNMII
jgi:autophagy-related protein 9